MKGGGEGSWGGEEGEWRNDSRDEIVGEDRLQDRE